MSNLEEKDEVIDIEEYTNSNKPIPKKKKYRISIDGEKYVVNSDTLTGREILEIAKKIPPACFILYQKLKGHKDPIKIQLDEIVDLTKPGIERFTTKEHTGITTYYLDGTAYTTTEKTLTPVQILTNGGLDINNYYLKQIVGDEQISYKDKPNESLRICPGSKFISVFKGATEVSSK